MTGRLVAARFATTGADNRTYKRDRDGQFSSGGGMSSEEFATAVGQAATGADAMAAGALKRVPTAAEVSAIDSYGSASITMNSGLRTGATLSQADRDTMAGMDSVMATASLRADVVVHRRADLAHVFGAHADGDLTGIEWRDDGFVSTSVADRHGTARLRILVPKGTKGFSEDYTLDPDEIVLDRGLTFRVVSDQTGATGRRVDVEVIPQ